MKKDAEVVVVGGGAIGICSAYYLNRLGRQVTVLEQGEVASGSSFANAGLIVPSHSRPLAAPGVLGQGLRWLLDASSPFYIRARLDLTLVSWLWRFARASNEQQMRRGLRVLNALSFASLDLFEELIGDESLECDYRQGGLLAVFRTEDGLRQGLEQAHVLQEYGVETKTLNPEEAQQLEPSLRPGLVGAVFYTQDAHLDPAKFVQGLAERLKQGGVRIETHSRVLALETEGERVAAVRTERGEYRPDQVVLAAGAWSPQLVRPLGLKLPLQAAKGYSLTYERPPITPRLPLHLSEVRVAVTPLGRALRLAGTLELAGMDLSINPRRVAAIRRAAKDYLLISDGLGEAEAWRGLRPCTPDGLPMVDRSPEHRNLIVATGHCGLGISLAPITGKLAAQLACGQTPDLDLSPLALTRF